MSETAEASAGKDGETGVPPSAKVMLRVVYIMGIVLVLLFMALIGGIVWKASHKAAPQPVAPSALSLGLPAGTAIQSVTLDGDRMAVVTGSEIVIVDLRKNAVVARIATAGP